jgi:hypothetical protein|tara:strand:+ start:392 stop:631 length:240 start_codon:yes stop_codon:yes gene_type:complete
MNIVRNAAKHGNPTSIIMVRLEDFRLGHHYGHEIVDFLIRDRTNNSFLKSLLSQLKAKGTLSPKQIQVVLKMREATFNG